MYKFLLPLLFVLVCSGVSFSQSFNSYKLVDLNNDNDPDTIHYSLIKNESNWSASLTAISSIDDTLWYHPYKMQNDDFEDLLFQEDVNVEEWVNNYFSEESTYGLTYEKTKLTLQDLQPSWVEFYAKKEKLPPEELEQMILNQLFNMTLYYRASWREDLVMLVYVPQLTKFVGYSGGEY
ncbi:MAG: hypothetical protein JXR11_06860 [Balneola sp.]